MSDDFDGRPDGSTERKGTPTPKRSESEAARKAQMKKPVSRKDAKARSRNQRNTERSKQREALFGTGNAAHLPLRDRGPERACARAVVDRRRTVAEFMLPALVLVLFLSFIQAPWAYAAVMSIWFTILVALVIDSFILVRQLKAALRDRAGGSTKGHTFYAIMRSTQLRRFRLPKPAIGIGDDLPSRF